MEDEDGSEFPECPNTRGVFPNSPFCRMQEGEQWVLVQHDGRHREISHVYPPLQLHVVGQVEVTSHPNLFPLSSQCGSTSICSRPNRSLQQSRCRKDKIDVDIHTLLHCHLHVGSRCFCVHAAVRCGDSGAVFVAFILLFTFILYPFLVCRAWSRWDRVLCIPYCWVRTEKLCIK
jgi:hypothetical protein